MGIGAIPRRRAAGSSTVAAGRCLRTSGGAGARCPSSPPSAPWAGRVRAWPSAQDLSPCAGAGADRRPRRRSSEGRGPVRVVTASWGGSRGQQPAQTVLGERTGHCTRPRSGVRGIPTRTRKCLPTDAPLPDPGTSTNTDELLCVIPWCRPVPCHAPCVPVLRIGRRLERGPPGSPALIQPVSGSGRVTPSRVHWDGREPEARRGGSEGRTRSVSCPVRRVSVSRSAAVNWSTMCSSSPTSTGTQAVRACRAMPWPPGTEVTGSVGLGGQRQGEQPGAGGGLGLAELLVRDDPEPIRRVWATHLLAERERARPRGGQRGREASRSPAVPGQHT
ncbi:hypothetical protein SCANM63S_05393 [Streptomyces canarius]